MKYFTKSMWRGSQQVGPEAEENYARWQGAFEAYRLELEELRGRVSDEAYKFFTDADVHDAELLDVRIVDGSRPTRLGEPAQPMAGLTAYPVRVELTILDAQDEYVWRLIYSSARSVVIDFPSEDQLFNRGIGGFDKCEVVRNVELTHRRSGNRASEPLSTSHFLALRGVPASQGSCGFP